MQIPPNNIIHLYTNGLCWCLALALHQISGLPIWVVRDDNDLEVHSFVFDEHTSTAYDIRGSLTISEVIYGPWKNGKTIAPWNRKVYVTKCNIEKAKKIAKQFIVWRIQ